MQDIYPAYEFAVVIPAFDNASRSAAWDSLRAECLAFTRGEIEPDTAAVAAPVFEKLPTGAHEVDETPLVTSKF